MPLKRQACCRTTLGSRESSRKAVSVVKKALMLCAASCAFVVMLVRTIQWRYPESFDSAVALRKLALPPSKRCDDDCLKFRQLLIPEKLGGNWPDSKPKAAIVMLVGEWGFSAAKSLTEFLQNFDEHFNERFDYPIVIFHDIPDLNVTTRLRVRSTTRSSIFFQFVNFTIPDFIDLSAITNNCDGLKRFGLGYRHMCRFQAKTIYKQPIMETEFLEYVWRLDDDSRFTKPIHTDLFVEMRDQGLKYGYYRKIKDVLTCVRGLWAAAEKHWQKLGIRKKFHLPNTQLFANNFELSAMSLWRSKEYNDYIEFIDRLGGIYYNRWGDAPIKSLAVSRLVSENQTRHFWELGYEHGGRHKKHSNP